MRYQKTAATLSIIYLVTLMLEMFFLERSLSDSTRSLVVSDTRNEAQPKGSMIRQPFGSGSIISSKQIMNNISSSDRIYGRVTIGSTEKENIVTVQTPGMVPHTDNRIVYFLHIHKSGGTNMCFAAKLNGMKVAATNCNVQKDQRCCGGNDSLDAQRQFALQTHLELVANERDMYESMDTEHYHYVTMLRRSRDRYKSHWKHVRRAHTNVTDSFAEWWSKQPDNWNVRKICGTRCMKIPKYKLTEELYNYTRERLTRFDDILFVEYYSRTFRDFAAKVGWTKMPFPDNYEGPAVHPFTAEDKRLWDPKMSALDDALYEYAQNQYVGMKERELSYTTKKALESYFEEGPRQNCISLCCSNKCSQY